MCNFVVVATTKLHSNNKNNKKNNKYKNYCISDHWTENVCRLIFLFLLLLFFLCNFVAAVTKLHSNENNNNKEITLHSCTDQLKNWYILNNSTHSPALQCITYHSNSCSANDKNLNSWYIGSPYHSWPPDASTREVHLTEAQPDPKDNQKSRWSDVVLLLATRCLYWTLEVCTILGHQMSLLGGTSDWSSAWPKG